MAGIPSSLPQDTQQSNLNAGEYSYNHLYLAASAISVIYIIRSLGHTTQQSNYTALCVIKGIPSSFLRHTTIKLFKGSDYECIILAISMMDILGQKEIYSGRRRYYTTIKFYDKV